MNNNALRLIDNKDNYSHLQEVNNNEVLSTEISLKSELEKYLVKSRREQENVFSQLSLATGYSINDYNLFLNGKQKNRSKEFESRTIKVIEALNMLMDLSNNELKYCNETTNAKTISEVISICKEDKIIGLIKGDPGLGKSTTATMEAYENKGLYVLMDRTTKRMTPLLRSLQRQMGYSGYALGVHAMMDDLIFSVKHQFDILIIDQADYLSPDAIDILRTLSEKSNKGLCLIGLKGIDRKLNGGGAEVKQLKDRIRISIELDPPTFEDIELVLNVNWPGLTDELKKEFFKYSRKTYRILSHLIFHCRQELFSEDNLGTELTVEHIRNAAGMLPKASNEEMER